ncbi:hypothetical protein [uncultured Maribacter sp.]|uniref:hypothetical protein n=1 Tax=uncultured Maribacter sp. TaxID=431308 RepID=UPI00261A38CD|nr:hypothetical protein [uncultured Maribacter sp.]
MKNIKKIKYALFAVMAAFVMVLTLTTNSEGFSSGDTDLVGLDAIASANAEDCTVALYCAPGRQICKTVPNGGVYLGIPYWDCR